MKLLTKLSEIEQAKKGNIDNDKIDLLIKKIQSKGKVMQDVNLRYCPVKEVVAKR